MEGYGLIKEKNMIFLVELGKCYAISDAAFKAGISRAHAIRLVNKWIEKGWVVRVPRKQERYEFTQEGMSVLGGCVVMLGEIK